MLRTGMVGDGKLRCLGAMARDGRVPALHAAFKMMVMRGTVVLLAALAFANASAPASASTQDVSATHAAIVADYAQARARVTSINVVQSKVENYRHRLATECPGVGAKAPESEATLPMSHEVAVALWSIDYGYSAGPIEKFAKAIGPLRWTNSRVTRAAHTLASNLSALARIRLPDICADVRAWSATGFTVVPQRIVELVEHVESLNLPEIPWKLITPYVRGRDAGLVAYIRRAETKLAEAEFMLGQKDWYQVLQTVGLPP
jgi:hypothetical protein